ncbi:MAG: inorganic phosphate transporter, partial [Ignavibacteriales bacterium]|nr:inorganic phosphate transporter [Ignavibacteriales bacterium]
IFVSATPLRDLPVGEWFSISGNSQLFFLGGLAIAIGIYTYGYDVMVTVGSELYKTTPISGLVVVLAESIVLFMFSSQGLESLLKTLHLPALPLVPLSSTQAVIGAVIGVGMAKDWRGINIKVLGKIASGWLLAPVAAGIMAFVALFFVQNVFEQKVIKAVPYEITRTTLALCNKAGIDAMYLTELTGKRYSSTKAFKNAVLQHNDLEDKQFKAICSFAIVDSIEIDSSNITRAAKRTGLPAEAIAFCKQQHGKVFLNVPALEMFLWESKVFKQTIKAGDTLDVAAAVSTAVTLLTAGK